MLSNYEFNPLNKLYSRIYKIKVQTKDETPFWIKTN